MAAEGWKSKMKAYRLQLLKEPKNISAGGNETIQVECKLEDVKDKIAVKGEPDQSLGQNKAKEDLPRNL